ncbi:MAG: carboxypeptidase-like regulatory domain-containing protein [Firmicutes bacterium]|nr:carboxypeptidase-like regulatory domain-containing protein [Bacillota bacterium]
MRKSGFRISQIMLLLLTITLVSFLTGIFPNPLSASEKQKSSVVAQASKAKQTESGIFDLSGTISRPDREGKSLKPAGLTVYLYKAGSYKKYSATTDEKGRYTFKNIPAERYYILAAVSNFKYMVTEKQTVYTTVMVYGTPTPSPTQIDIQVEKNMGFSWHKMIDMKKPGVFNLDLNANNADNDFDNETEPDFSKRREAFKNITNASPVEE